jgi:Zn-dependent protease
MDYLVGRLLFLPGILLGISVHEFSHGLAADRLGDNTARLHGRLTLNPIRHLDPLGFLCLLLFGFGWAKPVMINPRNFKDPVRDDAIVSLAGPVSNFLIAFLFTGFMKLADMFLPVTLLGQIIFEVLRSTVHINLVLMVFNLLPNISNSLLSLISMVSGIVLDFGLKIFLTLFSTPSPPSPKAYLKPHL